MRGGGTDSGNDTLADARDDGFLARAADQSVDVGAHGNARLGAQLDAVLGYCGDYRGFDYLRVNAHLHGHQHVAARQVDCGRAGELQRYARALRRDKRVDHAVDVTARQQVGFKSVDRYVQTGLGALNQRQHHALGIDAAYAHTYQSAQANLHARSHGRNPQSERHH